MITPEQALSCLQEGNRRFVAGLESKQSQAPFHAVELLEVQAPFAIVLGCSDSRVPAELVFHQGLGDLFVIRVAGNIVARSQIGSVEFAVQHYGTPLVVVLGHSRCGAVEAAVDQREGLLSGQSHCLEFIVRSINPCVQSVLEKNPGLDRADLIGQAARENIRAAVSTLRNDSAILAPLIEAHRLRIVGAEYSLKTGAVEFLQDTLWNV